MIGPLIKVSLVSGILIGFAFASIPSAALAQENTRATDPARPDSSSAVAVSDSTIIPWLGYKSAQRVGQQLKTDFVLAPFPELVRSISDATGALLYDLSSTGWAHGLSLFGSEPNTVGLRYGALPLDDLFFGKPRFDFAPVTSIESLRILPAGNGRSQSFDITPRDYDGAKPLTEALYWSGSDALQSVSITHTQRRLSKFLGRPGQLGLLAGYHGAASTGEYPSSKLTRARQMMARLRYERPTWSVELLELYNRGSVSQHSGVNPPIYRRLEASVSNSGAARQTRRNDLSVTFRAKSIGQIPFESNVSYSRQSDVYLARSPSVDTLRTKTHRIGLSALQPLEFGYGTVTLFASSAFDDLRNTNWIADSLSESVLATDVGVRFASSGAVELDSEVSVQNAGDKTGLGISISVTKDVGLFSVLATAGSAPSHQSLFIRNGYAGLVRNDGGLILPGSTEHIGRISNGRLELGFTAGSVRLTIGSFINVDGAGGSVLVSTTSDTLTYVVVPTTSRVGFTGTASWRNNPARGIYASIATTVSPWSTSTNLAVLRESQSRPELFTRGVLGARYTLFKGDLIANAYIRGTAWTEFSSRLFHAQTGLFTLPSGAASTVPASYSFDVVVEAIVRTATIFLSYENALAGTQLLEGNLLVDGYPLADQRVRFGVFWPIFD